MWLVIGVGAVLAFLALKRANTVTSLSGPATSQLQSSKLPPIPIRPDAAPSPWAERVAQFELGNLGAVSVVAPPAAASGAGSGSSTPGGGGTTTGGGYTGTGGSTNPCFSGNTRVKTLDGPKRFDEMKSREVIWAGPLGKQRYISADLIVHEELKRKLIDMGDGELVTPEHLILADEGWKPAAEVFSGRVVEIVCRVYNFHNDTENDAYKNYWLENGHLAHNSKTTQL